MNKKEAIEVIKKSKGYLPYAQIFDLYNDDEEVPVELVNIFCKRPKPKKIDILCGQFVFDKLNSAISEFNNTVVKLKGKKVNRRRKK